MLHLLIALAVVLPSGLDPTDAVEMENDVAFIGAEAPYEVSAGEPFEMTLYFEADEALPGGVKNFVHVESAETGCRVVQDRRPTRYEEGVLVHTLRLTVPDSNQCKPQRLDVYTGFYRAGSGQRFIVESISTPDNRVPAAYFDIAAPGTEPDTEQRAMTPSDMQRRASLRLLEPWWGWLGMVGGAIALCIAMGWLVRRRDGADDDAAGEEDADDDADSAGSGLLSGGWTPSVPVRSWWVILALVLLAVPAVASILVALDFVKDDAYISFRYAHNLVEGRGLVFNPGERIEGFTNFLWTLVLAPFEAMGLDMFQVVEVLGTALVLGILAQMTWLNFT